MPEPVSAGGIARALPLLGEGAAAPFAPFLPAPAEAVAPAVEAAVGSGSFAIETYLLSELAAFEAGLAALLARVERLLMVLGNPGLCKEIGLESARLLVIGGGVFVDHPLDRPHRHPWIGRDRARELLSRCEHLSARYNLIGEPDAAGLGGVDQLAGEEQRQRPGAADEPDESAASAPCGRDSEIDLLEAEMGAVAD